MYKPCVDFKLAKIFKHMNAPSSFNEKLTRHIT